jgi:hypothetical protein
MHGIVHTRGNQGEMLVWKLVERRQIVLDAANLIEDASQMFRQQLFDDFAECAGGDNTTDGLHLPGCGDDVRVLAIVHDKHVAIAFDNFLKERKQRHESRILRTCTARQSEG